MEIVLEAYLPDLSAFSVQCVEESCAGLRRETEWFPSLAEVISACEDWEYLRGFREHPGTFGESQSKRAARKAGERWAMRKRAELENGEQN